ncbi:HPP family protein [Halorubellus sp. JP-L1]|uniref:HPP family protein n=1 Tax=Halorubellus sp. JP-L1 TaxID=2715753 RepID=UPI001407923D|nr:HPP family protein [Halorubellus sp. JP-L1]NHN42135.1 HPP family protein [Halorubellus sp. JP-L1]
MSDSTPATFAGEVVRSAYAGGLLVASTVAAWLLGVALVFPSLGPSAYVLATVDDPPTRRRVVAGHAVGVAAGAGAYYALAGGLAVTAALEPGSTATLRLGLAGVVSVAATTFGMRYFSVPHAPACATTLIVSLGLLTAPLELVGIVASVGVLVVVDAAVNRSGLV